MTMTDYQNIDRKYMSDKKGLSAADVYAVSSSPSAH